MGVKIYIIQEKYIDYLRESDEKVLKNKSEKKEEAKEITADIYLKMSEKELKEYIKIKEKEEAKNLSDEEKLYQVPISYYNISDLKITKEIEQKFVPIKEKIAEKSRDREFER